MITKIQPVRKDNGDDVLDAAAYTDGEHLLVGCAVRTMKQELIRLTLWDSVRTAHPT